MNERRERVPEDEGGGRSESRNDDTDFASAANESQPSLLAEFLVFLRTEKKWWLAPIVIVLLALTVLAWVGGSSLAPFIYPGL